MSKEVTISKGHPRDGETEVESVIIKIEKELPDYIELAELYDPTAYFKSQAELLSNALYDALPYGTFYELVILTSKRVLEELQDK